MKRQKSKGFTLIELLVVVAIIGILATIVLVSLGSARAKARDSRRVADIRQLQLALEMFNDSNGRYPIVALSAAGGLTPTFMSKVPTDPSNSDAYRYAFSPDTTPNKYHLGGNLENSDNISLQGDADCNSSAVGGCGASSPIYFFPSGTALGFNGADSSYCIEAGGPTPAATYCYDVKP